MRFSLRHLLATILLLLTEIGIALFVHDSVIRPFVGDVLVVVLIYTTLRTFLTAEAKTVAIGTLLFAFTIETLQYFDYVALLGLQDNRVLSVMLGRTFSWEDFLAYFTGFLLCRMAER